MRCMLARYPLFVFALLSIGCTDPCALEARLASSAAGDVIDVAGCSLVGSFRVPPGVTVRGPASLDGSITLETETGLTTVLDDVDVTTERLGVATIGTGVARIEDGSVTVTRGVGLSLSASEGHVERMTLTGNVTEANRDESRWLSSTSATDATHGLLVGAGTVEVIDARITGFSWAAVSAGSGLTEGTGPVDLTVRTSVVGQGLGVGISSSAEQLELDRVVVDEVWSGVRGWPSFALLAISGEVTSASSSITHADGFGLVQLAGTSNHGDLVIEHTGDVGAWFGTAVEAGFIGAGTRIADTGFAGILAVDAASLAMVGGTIEGVRAERRTVGVSGAIEVGDGIDAIGTAVALRDLSITGAERAGLLLDRAMPASALTNVRITSEGAGLGAVQGTIDRAAEDFTVAAVPGWDVGITRLGAALANDAAFSGSLPVAVSARPPSAADALAVVAPMY